MLQTWIIMLGVLFGTGVWAADAECGSDCDLARLIEICRSLEKDSQIKPFTTEMKCSGSLSFWELAKTESFDLTNILRITSKMSMKGGKYSIPDTHYRMNTPPSPAECNIYKELLGHYVPVSKILYSCAELEAVYEMGQGAYCQKLIDEAGGELTETKPTGKTYSTCPCADTADKLTLGAELERVKQTAEDRYWYDLEVKQVSSPRGLVARAGLQSGDHLFSVRSIQVDSLESLTGILNDAVEKGLKEVEIRYRRGNSKTLQAGKFSWQ